MINWKVRLKNPYFWLGILGAIFMAMDINFQDVTSWSIFVEHFKELINNPYMLFSVIFVVIGIVTDPTTSGFKDSENALGYTEPKK